MREKKRLHKIKNKTLEFILNVINNNNNNIM